jgi:hypothetical protein
VAEVVVPVVTVGAVVMVVAAVMAEKKLEVVELEEPSEVAVMVPNPLDKLLEQ